MEDPVETGERLSAYLADELDTDERTAVEAELARDPAVARQLERIRSANAALDGLAPVDPPEGFSLRLREAVGEHVRDVDELATWRHARAGAPWRTLGVAAAAALVIIGVGVGAGVLLRGGSLGDADGGAETAAQGEAGSDGSLAIAVVETDNDYDDRELSKLAVNLDLDDVLPPRLGSQAAGSLAAERQEQLLGRTVEDSDLSSSGDGTGAAEGDEGEFTALDRTETTAPAPAPQALRAQAGDAAEDVQRCLPEVLEGTTRPLIPLYVEIARYQGEPTIIYALASEDPESSTYRRVEVWAVARDPAADCAVRSFAQYDRTDR